MQLLHTDPAAVAGLCYFGVSILGFWAFGTAVGDNVLLAFQHGPHSWVVAMANIMVVVHVAAAYQVGLSSCADTHKACQVACKCIWTPVGSPLGTTRPQHQVYEAVELPGSVMAGLTQRCCKPEPICACPSTRVLQGSYEGIACAPKQPQQVCAV